MKTAQLDSSHYEIVKLRAGDLRIGMFVAELDRPWQETPFLFEGFEIENEADLEAVKRHCNYVYIDLGRTRALRVSLGQRSSHRTSCGKPPSSFEQEIVCAEKTGTETSKLIKTFEDEIRFGKPPDIGVAKSAVSECVASVMRNPEALLLVTKMKAKNPLSSIHAFNTCVYAILLGRLLGLKPAELENAGTCGLLYDVGNLEVPDPILNKSAPLSDKEFAIIKQHTTFGRDILMSGRNICAGAVDVAYGHHECLDGSGYPRLLTGSQINLNTRLVSVIDRYAGIVRQTPYHGAHLHLDAVNILTKLADSHKIDKGMCTAFLSYLGFYPPGSLVELNSGEVGIVLKSSEKRRLWPLLLIVRDAQGNPVERLLDLLAKPLDSQGKPCKIKQVHAAGYLGIDLSCYMAALIRAYD